MSNTPNQQFHKSTYQKPGPVLTRLSDVEPTPIRWLWPGRIPLGKLTLFCGDPGIGKSFTTIDCAARVSMGKPWPGESNGSPTGGVVLLSAEDDVSDTIRPRLDACGADVSRIYSLLAVRDAVENGGASRERPFQLSRDTTP